MNTIIEKRKQNWIDFYDLSSPVSRLLIMKYNGDLPPTPPLWWENMREREEHAYRVYMMQLENMEKLPDNTIPFLSMITGTEIFAEAFGCKVHKPEGSNPFALPLIHDVSEWYKIKMPKWEDTNLALLFESADRLKARVGENALFSLPDIQTPLDITALIWEKSDFYASMFDEEPAILELAEMIKELLFSFFDEWFRRYGSAFIAHFPDYYMPYGITVSEDEIGIVSNEMYKKYFQNELHEIARRYGAIGIHCCADARHHWESLKEVPNLKLLNLGYEPDLKEAISCFGGSVAQYHSLDLDLTDLPDYQKIHSANYVYVNTLEEAIEYAKRYNERNHLDL